MSFGPYEGGYAGVSLQSPNLEYNVQYGGYLPPQAASSPENEIKTIVVTGFPEDVKERELNNLLLFLPGYIASVLNWDKNSPEGKALFETASQAQDAAVLIDGKIEFETGQVLSARLASENITLTEHSNKRARVNTYPTLSHQSTIQAYPATSSAGMIPVASPYAFPGATAAPVLTPPLRAYAPLKNEKDNPPCNTLFIGNLGEAVDENELRAVFGNLPGFQQVKVVRSSKGIAAFVEFADVPSATICHDGQQGLILATSDRGPIRLQYSKNPFGLGGRKRDIEGDHLRLSGGAGGYRAARNLMPSLATGIPQILPPAAYGGGYPMALAQPGILPAGAGYGLPAMYSPTSAAQLYMSMVPASGGLQRL